MQVFMVHRVVSLPITAFLIAAASGCSAEGQGGEPLATESSAVVVANTLQPGQPFTPAADAGADGTYYPVAGAYCRDGQPAGVTVRATGSPDLLIYVEGGGVCFDNLNCFANGSLFNDEYIEPGHRVIPEHGIFDTTRGNQNPIAGWNVVYVPYCTGDAHLGTNPNGRIPLVSNSYEVDGGDPERLQFVGRTNLNLILESVVATFPSAERVLVAGASAGGLGSLGSALPVEQAFANAGKHVQVLLIDDSGPPVWGDPGAKPPAPDAHDYFPVAEQQAWRGLFGLDGSILADCGADCRDANGEVIPGYLTAFAAHVGRVLTAQGHQPGFVTSYHDVALGSLFATAKNDIYGTGTVGYSLENALDDLRSRVAAPGRSYFSTYYVNSPLHMWINQDALYSTIITQTAAPNGGALPLLGWVAEVIAGAPAPNAGPN